MKKHSYTLGSFLLLSPILLSQLTAVAIAPNLISPAPLEVLDNGCSPLQDERVWVFGWSEVPNAKYYHLYVIGANAINPVIDNPNIQSTDYIDRSSGYIADRNRMGWKWKVRAMVNGEWSDWSEEKVFNVEPLNTDCEKRDLSQLGAVPIAPNLIFPAQSEVLDNGCIPLKDERVWAFAWSEVPNAKYYHLYVKGANAINPVIDNPNIQSTDYIDRSSGYIADHNRMGWKWKVRAMVNGKWTDWSEERVFNVEPLNTDCEQRDLSQLGAVPIAPNLISPAPLEVLDNGCSPLKDERVWAFRWSEVPNAKYYHLYVKGANAINPVIDNPNIQSRDYIDRSSGFIIDRNRMGWRWKVRAMVNGEWTDWSEERVFNVEPLNTDCEQRDRTQSMKF